MIHIAVVGCGAAFRELHLPWLQVLERRAEVRVVALVDQARERSAQLCSSFMEAQAYGLPSEAYAERKVDLTVVASPPALHREHCLAALRAGSHVLCEKPLVTSAADADMLAAEASRVGRILAVGMARRFFPSVADAAALVARGELGSDLQFACREGGGYGWPVATDAPFRRELSGGGVLMDRGVHVIDTLVALLGAPVVEAAFDDAMVGGVEGNSLVKMRCGAARGFVQLSWENELANGLYVRGTRGELKLDSGDHLHYYLRADRRDPWRRVRAAAKWYTSSKLNAARSLPESYESCIYFEIVHMLRAVLHGEVMPVMAGDAATVIRAIENAYAIAQPIDASWLPDRESERLRSGHWRASL